MLLLCVMLYSVSILGSKAVVEKYFYGAFQCCIYGIRNG